LKTGLKHQQWAQPKEHAHSNLNGFPIQDTWQAEFHWSIGNYMPKQLAFGKENMWRNPSTGLTLFFGDWLHTSNSISDL